MAFASGHAAVCSANREGLGGTRLLAIAAVVVAGLAVGAAVELDESSEERQFIRAWQEVYPWLTEAELKQRYRGRQNVLAWTKYRLNGEYHDQGTSTVLGGPEHGARWAPPATGGLQHKIVAVA